MTYSKLPKDYIVYSADHYKDTPDFTHFVKTVGKDTGGIGPEKQFYYMFPDGIFPKYNSSKNNCERSLERLKKEWDAYNWPIFTIEEWRELYNQKSEHYEIF